MFLLTQVYLFLQQIITLVVIHKIVYKYFSFNKSSQVVLFNCSRIHMNRTRTTYFEWYILQFKAWNLWWFVWIEYIRLCTNTIYVLVSVLLLPVCTYSRVICCLIVINFMFTLHYKPLLVMICSNTSHPCIKHCWLLDHKQIRLTKKGLLEMSVNRWTANGLQSP